MKDLHYAADNITLTLFTKTRYYYRLVKITCNMSHHIPLASRIYRLQLPVEKITVQCIFLKPDINTAFLNEKKACITLDIK